MKKDRPQSTCWIVVWSSGKSRTNAEQACFYMWPTFPPTEHGGEGTIVLNWDSLAYGSGLLTNFFQVLKETNAGEKYIARLWVGGDKVKEHNIHHTEKKNTKRWGRRRESEYFWDGNALLLHKPKESTRNEGGWRYGRDWAPEGGVKKTTLTLTSHTYTHTGQGHVYFSICLNVSH